MRKLLIGAGVGAGLLLGGLGVAGVASAHDQTGDDRPAMHEQHDSGAMGDRDGGRHGGPGAMVEGRGAKGGPAGAHRGDRAHLQELADALGVPVENIRQGFADGKSIAEIAADNGVDVDTVIEALTDKARERITDMVNRVPGDKPVGAPGADTEN